VNITVNAVNDAPTVAVPIPDVTVDEDAPDTTIDLSSAFVDVDIATNGDSLAFSVTNDNSALLTASVSGSDLTLDYAADQHGTANITVRATDLAGAYVEDSFLVTVNGVNDAPTVAVPIEDVTVFEDAPDTVLDLSETFADVDIATNGDSLTLSVTNDNPMLLTASIADSILTLDYAADQHGTANITVRATDLAGAFVEDTFLVTVNPVNNPPDCTPATPSTERIWPPNKRRWPVSVLGVTDPDGDPVTITIDRIFQDEERGRRQDAWIIGPNLAEVLAERDGHGDGRVYYIEFHADDGQGGICSGVVLVGIVPHDQSGELGDFDSGPPWYDSVTGERID
jgi:hypothetical protein